MNRYDEFEEDDYYAPPPPPPRQRSRIFSGFYFMIPIFLVALAGLGWGYYTYGDFAKLVGETQKKINIPLTTTPVPLDWREVSIENVNPKEMDKIQSYALAQALYDIFVASVILISLVFILSNTSQLNIDLKPAVFNKNALGLLVALTTLSAALYSVVFTYNTGIKRKTPFYTRWWFGNEYEWYTPWNMIGTMVTAAAVLTLIYKGLIPLPDLRTVYKDGTNAKAKTADKAKFYLFVMVAFYIIYSFYGAYLTSMIKNSDYFEPYLNYLYPFVVSCAISLLTYKITGKKDTGLVTLLACSGLIAFRSFGQQSNAVNLVSDMEFWTKTFASVLAFVVALMIISYVQGNQADHAKTLLKYGRKGLNRVKSTNAPTMFIAALLGVFLFFSMQLFWTTTKVTGDLTIAAIIALVLMVTVHDLSTHSEDVKMALLSGCLVTGVLWMNMYSQSTFQTLIS